MAEAESWEDLDEVPPVDDGVEDDVQDDAHTEAADATASQSDLTNTLHLMDVLLQPQQFDDREDKPMILLDWTSYSQGEITPANAGEADALYRRLTETLWQSWDDELEDLFEAGHAWHTTDLQVSRACDHAQATMLDCLLQWKEQLGHLEAQQSAHVFGPLNYPEYAFPVAVLVRWS